MLYSLSFETSRYLEDLQEGLLNTFSADIAGNAHVLQLSRDLHEAGCTGEAQS